MQTTNNNRLDETNTALSVGMSPQRSSSSQRRSSAFLASAASIELQGESSIRVEGVNASRPTWDIQQQQQQNDNSTISTNFTVRRGTPERNQGRAREWASAVDPVSQRVYWYNRLVAL